MASKECLAKIFFFGLVDVGSATQHSKEKTRVREGFFLFKKKKELSHCEIGGAIDVIM